MNTDEYINTDRKTIEEIVNNYFSKEDRAYEINSCTTMKIGPESMQMDSDDACFSIRYETKALSLSEEDGSLILSLSFSNQDTEMEFIFQERGPGLSYGELEEFSEGLNSISDSIEEYIENGELVDDFPIFKSMVTDALDKMETVYRAHKDSE